MTQDRLFRLAIEAGTVTFHHVAGAGWVLTVACRRGDEAWDEVQRETYSHLTTVELLDTIYACLDSTL
jgi:hypothetical protein